MKKLKKILLGLAAFLVLTAGVKAQAAEEYYPDPTQPFATITDITRCLVSFVTSLLLMQAPD